VVRGRGNKRPRHGGLNSTSTNDGPLSKRKRAVFFFFVENSETLANLNGAPATLIAGFARIGPARPSLQPPTPGVGLDNRAPYITIWVMPTRKVHFIKNNLYHIYNRGNRKQTIFFQDSDYIRFLKKAQEYKEKYQVEIVAYCLMPNHFHFILKQLGEIPLSQFIGTLLNSYARYASVRYELPVGHVFQGRFGAKLINSPESLLQVSRYIHLNPIKDILLALDYTYKDSRRIARNKALISKLREYPWSSYPFYLGSRRLSHVTICKDPVIKIEANAAGYRKFVESKITDDDILTLEEF